MAEIASLIVSFVMGISFGVVLSEMARKKSAAAGQLDECSGASATASMGASTAGGGGENRTRTAATGGAASFSAKDLGTGGDQ